MAAAVHPDVTLRSALALSRSALRRIADYELESGVANRLHELGERKEFLTEAEHQELLALVGFTERRTIEKLDSTAALTAIDRACEIPANGS
jgi:hypothetical protein